MITLKDALETEFTTETRFKKKTSFMLVLEDRLTGTTDTVQTISLSSDGKYIVRMWRGDMTTEVFFIGKIKFRLNVAAVISMVARDVREYNMH